MVYIHFPSNLTEEELMLQAKYAKLRKKKKALQALKAPKQEPEKNLLPKRPADARDAREVARKLLKSGAIQAIQKPQPKQEGSFKRPKGQERKRTPPEMSTAGQYQSFGASTEYESANSAVSASNTVGGMASAGSGVATSTVTSSTTTTSSTATTPPDGPNSPAEKETSRVQNLYQQFANERDKDQDQADKTKAGGEALKDRPRSGNTVYVSGNKVTENFLKKHFSEFGEILNISMEIEKGRGFITFSKTECADKAIGELHSKTVGGIQLQVQLARRQPQINPINDAGSSAVWSALATNRSQKGKHKDNRELVCYDHDDIF